MNPKSKAGRRAIAYKIADLAHGLGATLEVIEEWPAPGCREAMVRIELDGAAVSIGIDPRSAADGYCVPWHIRTDSDARFSPAFGVAAGAPVNAFHRRKCTAFYADLPSTLLFVERALRCIRDGEAFL
jgi:hypothetical protein